MFTAMLIIFGLIVGFFSALLETNSDKETQNIGHLAAIVAVVMVIIGIVQLFND